MWDVFYLPYPRNKEKKWDIFIHKYRFTLDYVKHHLNIIQKGFNADKYMVQNLNWYGVYLRITFQSTILQKVLELVPLTTT